MKMRGGASWAVYLLPYMEQDNPYQRWNFAMWYHYQDASVRQFNVPSYFCPSRRGPSTDLLQSVWGDLLAFPGVSDPIDTMATAIGRTFREPWPTAGTLAAWGLLRPRRAVAFNQKNPANWDKGVGLRDFYDGLSNTILLGEKNVPRDQWGVEGWDCSTYDGDMPVCSGRVAGPDYPIATTLFDYRWLFGSASPRVYLRLRGRQRS